MTPEGAFGDVDVKYRHIRKSVTSDWLEAGSFKVVGYRLCLTAVSLCAGGEIVSAMSTTLLPYWLCWEKRTKLTAKGSMCMLIGPEEVHTHAPMSCGRSVQPGN